MLAINLRLSSTLCLLLFLSACASSPTTISRFPAGAGGLELKITDFHNNQGEALISIYPGPLGFPDADAPEIIRILQPIRDKQVHFTLEKLPYHNYAIAVLHDENLNGHMDKPLVGLPLEGFGFSRNPTPLFGPPDYQESRFLFVTQQQIQTIEIQYPKMRKLHPTKADSSAAWLK